MARFQPMKGSVAPSDLTQLRYPLLASEKLDGWRSVIAPIEWARTNIPCEPKHREYFEAARWAIALSASNKPISNWHTQRQLDCPELIGCDGELLASAKFNETSSAFASYGGEPGFAFHIFDRFDRPNDPFEHRLYSLKSLYLPRLGDNTELHIHPHFELLDAAHLEEYLEELLPPGAEGAVTRDPKGLYKFGRATPKQQWMCKIKPFEDAEAVVVGVEELMHNLNEPEVNQLGRTRRSSHKEGKVGSGKLGALICKQIYGWQPDTSLDNIGGTKRDTVIDGVEFRIGTGFDDATRRLLWAQRDSLPGRIVCYKSMKKGAKDAPRHPVFRGFRYEDYS